MGTKAKQSTTKQLTYAGVLVTLASVLATIKLLDYFHRFLKSEADYAYDPTKSWPGVKITKEQAKKRLGYLIDVAINRRAGIPDFDRDTLTPYYRDQRRLLEINTQRMRHYQFETVEARERFGHLLASHDD